MPGSGKLCELSGIRYGSFDEQLELHCAQTTLARKKMQLEALLRLASQAAANIRLDQEHLLAGRAVLLKYVLIVFACCVLCTAANHGRPAAPEEASPL